jgi:hypothetical protein
LRTTAPDHKPDCPHGVVVRFGDFAWLHQLRTKKQSIRGSHFERRWPKTDEPSKGLLKVESLAGVIKSG